jgi:hypothetical protein
MLEALEILLESGADLKELHQAPAAVGTGVKGSKGFMLYMQGEASLHFLRRASHQACCSTESRLAAFHPSACTAASFHSMCTIL